MEHIGHSSGFYHGSEKATRGYSETCVEIVNVFMSFEIYEQSHCMSLHLIAVNLTSEFQKSQLDNGERVAF